MKLLVSVLLLAALLFPSPSQGDGVWSEQQPSTDLGHVTGHVQYLKGAKGKGVDSYSRAAAARAAEARAAGGGKGDDAETAGRGFDRDHQKQLPSRRFHIKKRRFKPCVPFHPVESLMGDAATDCAECLTESAILGKDSHDDYSGYGSTKCHDLCDLVPRGSEFFVPLPTNRLVKKCKPGNTCYQGEYSTSACKCCGRNLGMNYNMPPASKTDFLGETSNFRRSCAEPVSANNCQACLLWRKLRGNYFQGNLTTLPCTQGERCFVTKDDKHTLMDTAIVNDPYHYLLLPGSSQADWPVIGIEDPQVLTRRLEHIWDLAWKLAFKPYSQLPFTVPFSVPDLPVANHSCRIGLALNPASARSQHQLHIHIARIPTPLRKLFVGRRKNFKEWTKVKIPITKKKYTSWPIVYARYLSLEDDIFDDEKKRDRRRDRNGDDDTTGEGFAFPNRFYKKDNVTMGGEELSDYHIFRQAFNFARRSFLRLQAWGILIIPDEESIYLRKKHAPLPRGFYLVLSTNNKYGTWNSYRATAVNANFSPELLLCTSYSAGAGHFWKPEECYGDLLFRTDTAPGLREALDASTSSRFTDGFVAQQLQQDYTNPGTGAGGGGSYANVGGASGTAQDYANPGASAAGGGYYADVVGVGAGAFKPYSNPDTGAGGGGAYADPGTGAGGGGSYGDAGAAGSFKPYANPGTGAGSGGSYANPGTAAGSGGAYADPITGAGGGGSYADVVGANAGSGGSNYGDAGAAGSFKPYANPGTGAGSGGNYADVGGAGATAHEYANPGTGAGSGGSSYADVVEAGAAAKSGAFSSALKRAGAEGDNGGTPHAAPGSSIASVVAGGK